MTDNTHSYRPHNPGHDYYASGIYLITLVVRNRHENARMFGTLNNDVHQSAVAHNDVGRAVMECWESIPLRQARHGRKMAVHTAVCMPDHFHGVIEVQEKMDVSLGEVIRGFKAGCTMAWHECRRPSMAAEVEKQPRTETLPMAAGAEGQRVTGGEGQWNTGTEALQPAGAEGWAAQGAAQPHLDEQEVRERLKRMSKKQRAEYYAQHPEAQQPLWDDNYDDTICLMDPVTGSYCERHFKAMLHYVADNARRAIIMKQRPEFMQRCLHVRITGTDSQGKPTVRDYAAFGNLFLLRWTRKVQVYCHRLARRIMLTNEEWQKATATSAAIHSFETHARAHRLGHFDRQWYLSANPTTITAIDYSRTAAYRHEHDAWVTQVMAGQTVIVTPGISKGEQLMKDECLERGYPLIHLQKEPIGAQWKPEKTRFEACSEGRLLILAPWKTEGLGDVGGVPSATDYSVFHNLNRLAEELCLFEGDAVVMKK